MKMQKMMQMDKTLAKFSSRNLSPRQLFFLSKAQINNSAFVFGNMYSLHFAHYLRLDSSCKKGPLSLQEEQQLLSDTFEQVQSNSSLTSSPNSSPNNSPSSSPTHNPNSNSNSSTANQITHSDIAVCLAPGLPFILQHFQSLDKYTITDHIVKHMKKIDQICRKNNRMLIVGGYLPVKTGAFLTPAEANKINSVLLHLDDVLQKHKIFKNKFVKYFNLRSCVNDPELRNCGIYPTSACYKTIGHKLQEFILRISME